MSSPVLDLRQYMAQVVDPRGRKGKRHPLSAILPAVICSVLSGANDYKPIAQWLHTQTIDFWHFLGFTRRPLKYGALRNLLLVLPPETFFRTAIDGNRAEHRRISLSTERIPESCRSTTRICLESSTSFPNTGLCEKLNYPAGVTDLPES